MHAKDMERELKSLQKINATQKEESQRRMNLVNELRGKVESLSRRNQELENEATQQKNLLTAQEGKYERKIAAMKNQV